MEGRGRDKGETFCAWDNLVVIGQRGDIEVLGSPLVVMELVRAARDDFIRLALAVGHRVAAALLTVEQLVPQANSADIAIDGLDNYL